MFQRLTGDGLSLHRISLPGYGKIQRQFPHAELVYGVTDRWEISAEGNYLSRDGKHGLDDLTLATKLALLPEGKRRARLGGKLRA